MGADFELLQRAISFAARAHQGHFRKDGETPYFAHPVRVMMLVRRFGCEDPEVLAAAVLHDTIEDTRTDWDDLAQQFSPRVADLVALLSKDARVPEPQREREYFHRLRNGPSEGLLCKLCDTLDNLAESNTLSVHARRRATARAEELIRSLGDAFAAAWPAARDTLQEALAKARGGLVGVE